jgi:hypothetical protein
VSGHLILNVETIFALATIVLSLSRCQTRKVDPASHSRFRMEGGDVLPIASIALLSVAAFWRASHIYFLSDDFVIVDMAQAIQGNYSMFTHGGGDGFFRPVGYVSLAWTWPWAGLDPIRWHWVGLVLHIVNCWLVYSLALAIGLSRMGAWFASALFALHGAHPEAVVWIAGRFDVLATSFVLLALVAFVKFWHRPSILLGVTTGLAMVLGVLSKESAYALPLMMLVFVASQPGRWSRRLRLVAPFFLLAAGLFAYRWVMQGGIGVT